MPFCQRQIQDIPPSSIPPTVVMLKLGNSWLVSQKNKRETLSSIYLSLVMRKPVFDGLRPDKGSNQPVQLQRRDSVSNCGLSHYTIWAVSNNNKGTDQIARMRRLIWAYVVPIWHMAGFLMAWLILFQLNKKHKELVDCHILKCSVVLHSRRNQVPGGNHWPWMDHHYPATSGLKRWQAKALALHYRGPKEKKMMVMKKEELDLKSVSSQCARGKSSIARNPEDHPKIFKW